MFPNETMPGQVDESDYEAYTYDASGNRTSLRKRDGSELNYTYDALGRLTFKEVPPRPAPHPYPLTAAQTRDVYYGYDLQGRQLFAQRTEMGRERLRELQR